MANITQIITIKRAWWVMPFIYCVRLFSGLTGMEVDYDKLAVTVVRGLKPVFK